MSAKKAARRVRVSPKETKGSKGPARAYAARVARAQERWEKHVRRIKAYGFPNHLVDAAAENLLSAHAELASQLDKVPDGWKPARGTVPTSLLEIGSKVMLREKIADRYAGIVDSDAEFTVHRIVRNRIVCKVKTDDGNMLVPMLRSHVQRVEAA